MTNPDKAALDEVKDMAIRQTQLQLLYYLAKGIKKAPDIGAASSLIEELLDKSAKGELIDYA